MQNGEAENGRGIMRRRFALFLFAAIIVLRGEPQLVRILFQDRSALGRALTGYADRLWPQYPRFLEGVRARTEPGDSIAIVVPKMKWDEGYSYAYYRASYFLTGREILPLVDAKDGLHPENFRDAKFVAAWNSSMPQGRYTVAWSGEGGVLLRR